ncbi:biosynthetic peptidoglycan transglycosylase [Bradymonas sediminis]|nr:biosynthetic peptidoglycan transglycosylase [Bradymonas sediminis]TDP62371.1 transglycosylase [Bradymonas sediminis]
MSRRFVYFALIGLLLGALLVGLPYGLKHLAEQQLRAQLDQRGVDLQWEELAWQWPTTVELSDVKFSTQRATFQISGGIERVEVALSSSSMLGKSAEIGDVSLASGTLKIQKLAGDPALDSAQNDVAPDSPQTTVAAVENLWAKLWEGLGKTGNIEAKDLKIQLLDESHTLLEMQITEVVLSEDALRENTAGDPNFLPPSTAHRTLRAQGEVELKTAKYSAIFAQLTAPENPDSADFEFPPIPWSLDAYLAAADQSITLKLGAPSPEDALLSLNIPNIADLNLHHVTASTDRTLKLDLSAHQASARLGSVAKPALEVDVLQIRATRASPTASIAWSIIEPTLAVAPTRLTELQRNLTDLRDALKPEPTADDKPAAKSNKSGGWRMRLTHWLQRGDLSIVNGHFDLRLVEGGEVAREIALVQNFDGTLRDGRLQTKGVSAGGRVRLGAKFTPGSWLPHAVALELDNIRLDDLPGVQEGRTLPKRGVRGRIGGIIDANLRLWTHGELAPVRSATASVNLGGSLTWRDGNVDISGLADTPIDAINASTEFLLSWAANTSRVELSQARVQYGPIVGNLRGQWRDYPLDPVLDLALDIDEIGCQDAVRALPDALLGAYRDIEIEGKAAPRFSLHLPVYHPRKIRIQVEDFVDLCHVTALKARKSAWPDLTIAAHAAPKPAPAQKPARFNPSGLLAHFGAAPTPAPWPAPPFVRDETYELPEIPSTHQRNRFDDVHWLNRPFIKQVTEGVTEEVEVLVGPGTPDYKPLRDLPPYVGAAAYLSEEMEFYENHGIDLGLIQRALRIDFEKGRFVYGGSTITQQLVKNLFLSRDKKLARKFKEALISWRIEDTVPKWRVLELYINVIEYAQDIYGIGPAARYYFDKDAADLTPREAVFLAVLKPAPWYGDRFRRRRSTPTKHWWFDRMGEIMGRLVDKGYLTAEQAEAEKPYILEWDKDGRYIPAAAPAVAVEPAEPEAAPRNTAPQGMDLAPHITDSANPPGDERD